jgi:cation diffusion facilitator family transporter
VTRTSRRSSEKAALFALLITGLLMLAKFILWLSTGSLAVLSQALDSGVDLIALGLVYVGVRLAGKPADTTHHYGHSKAENLAALGQTMFLVVVMVGVITEAGRRLVGAAPHDIATPGYAFLVLGLSAIVDMVRVAWLVSTARRERSDALLAAALNIASDIATVAITIGSLALVSNGVEQADAIGALVVAIFVGIAALGLGKRSVDVLMDRAPEAPVEAIREAAAGATGVAETRRVRVRSAGGQLFADVTVAAGRTTSLERAHDIAEAVESEIARVVPGADVVVHVEPATEESGLVERVQAAASRVEGVQEVHNVLVHAFQDSGETKLHVTLHAKVPVDATVGTAHDLSDRIEAEVEAELGSGVRVDTHLEPLETTVLGRDVTGARSDVVETVRRIATDETDVIDCHEIVVSSSEGELRVVAHVRGRGDLPLSRMHQAADRIEKAVHTAHPDVGYVLIHFEPAE